MLRMCIGSLLLCLAVSAPGAPAPLPEGPPLDQTVSLEAADQTAGDVLAELGNKTGITFSVADHVDGTRITVGAHECPLRDVMAAIASTTRLDWEPKGERAYHLSAPAFFAPVVRADRLLAILQAACPSAMRPRPGAAPDLTEEPPPFGDAVYAALKGPALDRIEEGEEVPFVELPALARRALRQWYTETGRRRLAGLQDAWWARPADCVGVRVVTFFGSPCWMGVKRWRPGAGTLTGPAPPPDVPYTAWARFGVPLPYQPPELHVPVRDPARRLPQDAVALSRRLGTTVVFSGMGSREAPAVPEDQPPEEALASLLPAEPEGISSWQRTGNAYWLAVRDSAEPRTVPSTTNRYREILAQLLPAEYAPFLAMAARDRWRATAAPLACLWQSLPEGRRASDRPFVVSDLSREQQQWFSQAVQASLVSSHLSILDGLLAGDLEHAGLSLDFNRQGSSMGSLGYDRRLCIRVGGATEVVGGVRALPPMLRFLPSRSPVLARRVDLEAKDTPLSEMIARLSPLLEAPVAAREPAAEVKLNGTFHQRPVRLLLHWIERRTGLEWHVRGGGFALTEPLSAAVAAGAKRGVEALRAACPSLPGEVSLSIRSWRPEANAGDVATDADREAIAGGGARFSELSPELQESIRQQLGYRMHRRLAEIGNDWQSIERLGEMRVYVRETNDGEGKRYTSLNVGVPGLRSRGYAIPSAGR